MNESHMARLRFYLHANVKVRTKTTAFFIFYYKMATLMSVKVGSYCLIEKKLEVKQLC